MTNNYHIIYNSPIYDDTLFVELEAIAWELVNSGRIRIDTGTTSNCARILIPELGYSVAFSEKELKQPKLLEFTKRILAGFWAEKIQSSRMVIEKVEYTLSLLNKELSKNVPLANNLEIKIARILAQSAHPVVLRMLLWERTEIYVTYGYSIGDMLDVPTWRSSGNNSGMQSTDGRDAAVFVSCGGDPFGKTDKDHPEYGDGHPAIARMMVIAAQEMGHYSDIKRDYSGRQVGRYSANFDATRADHAVAEARKSDMHNINHIHQIFKHAGIEKLKEAEKSLKFYQKFKFKVFIKGWINLKLLFLYRSFVKQCVNKGLEFVKIAYHHEKFVALFLEAMVEDMKFNLAPQADVYKRENKMQEEAILCVEALARVPQQVIKYGKLATKSFYPNLYNIYYAKVIPGCITAYENMCGVKYSFKLSAPKFAHLKRFLRRKLPFVR
ncbi:DUF2748 family protein [Rickettsiales endosymbiont of Stachyamoeba lipophora]|uniref:DUF2748 family protein n=1 Tax=Rickettsiales endosymbiont of Stachyamoeba lipophora TaxID=2486578 RepID=UPI000F648F5A|nr:DUF2748 family protein [Rickettsiales endosymbiont of Stachyamoeba lipophora]AZL15283.1 DUF2748 domain-containing protein [Rickettsiales endosymbiont of Stachyamoeba lipophora]